jgi:hypothetical protein
MEGASRSNEIEGRRDFISTGGCRRLSIVNYSNKDFILFKLKRFKGIILRA